MKLKDKIRYLLAKILFKKTILFSFENDRMWNIKKRITGYVPFFYEFDEVNLNKFKVVVPLTIPALRYINAYPELFSDKVCICPSGECVDLCDDKESLHIYLAENGFKQFTPKYNEKFSYPYVIKKKIGDFGEGVFVINDEGSEKEHADKIESEDYFTLEYITGQDEYACHIIVADGRIVFFKTIKHIFQDDHFIKGKHCEPAASEEVDHNKFKPIFEEILLSMNYQGICCIDYKITDEGLKIFEINPRYGASMDSFINDALIDYCHYGSSGRRVQGAP